MNSSSGTGDCSSDVDEMQTAGSSKALSVQQLLSAPITRTFPRFLWTRQHFSAGLSFSCQLFDRLQGATAPMKLPVQVHVVVQPADWDAAQYVINRAPQQQLGVTHSNSSVLEAEGVSDAGWEEVHAAALPTAAVGLGSNPLGPFPAFVSRSKSARLMLVGLKHNSKLDAYLSVSSSPDAHDIVVFEQVCVCVLEHEAEVVRLIVDD